MSNDPFASVNTDEAQQEPTATVETSKEKPVIVSDQSKLTVTLKGGSGYAAPWIVLHADTPQEALTVLQDETLRELILQTQKVGGFFAEKEPASAKQSAPQNRGGAPAGAQQPPAGAPEKPEGWVYKTGISKKTGKPWKGYFPPQGDDSKPIFFN